MICWLEKKNMLMNPMVVLGRKVSKLISPEKKSRDLSILDNQFEMPCLMTLAMNKPGRVYCMTNFCRRFKQSAQTIVLFLRNTYTGLLTETQTGIERVHVVKRDG